MTTNCLCCGALIPEGMDACPNCLVVSKRFDDEIEFDYDAEDDYD